MAAGFELAFSLGPRTKLSRFRESWDGFAPPDGLFTADVYGFTLRCIVDA